MAKRPTYKELQQRVKELEKKAAGFEQAQEALRKSEERYRRITEAVTDYIFTVRIEDGKAVETVHGPACISVTGYRQEEFAADPYLWISMVHEQDREAVRGQARQIPSGLATSSLEHRIYKKDGSVRWVKNTPIPHYDPSGRLLSYDGLIEDITERKQAEEQLCDSETTVRKKLDAILEPGGDIGELGLADIIDYEALQAMMEDLYRFSKIGSAVLDISGKVLVAVGWQDICTKFHRVHSDTEQNCRESDIILTSGVPVGTFKAYRCRNNMWDMVTPIEVGGKHIGNIFLGQFFFEDETPDHDLFRRQAHEHGFDETQYLSALDLVPRWSRETVDAVMAFYAKLAGMISSLSYGAIKFSRVISEKDMALRELRESEEKYRRLVENLDQSYFFYSHNTNGVFTYVSPSITNILGYSQEEFLAHYSKYLTSHPLNKQVEHHTTLNIQGKKQLPYEVEIWHKNGDAHRLEVSEVPVFDNEGNVIGVEGIARDITDRVKMEETKNRLETRLQQAQKMEAIGTLAGGIAHDFNNILTPVIIQTELALLNVTPDSPIRNSLNEVLEASHRAKDLVKQILTFSRQKETKRVPLTVSPILKEALKLLRSTLPTTIEIVQEIAAETGTVLAEPTQIHQVLMNLCTNGAHAMREKGGVLKVGLSEVKIDAGDAVQYPNLIPGEYVTLTVSDTGHGIDPSVINRIFDPFFTTKGPGEGTGMGLSVVHGIAKSHGGAITVESQPGKGSTFTIFFPATERDVQKPGPADGALPRGTERILLVDDEISMVRALEGMLKKLGYSVVSRTSSIEALEAFKAKPDHYDIVVTDQTMPNMTGIELVRALLNERQDLPIILCTGFSELIDAETARNMGIQFVIKPIEMKDMAVAVRRALDG